MRELASIKLVLASAGVVVRSEMGCKTSYMGCAVNGYVELHFRRAEGYTDHWIRIVY